MTVDEAITTIEHAASLIRKRQLKRFEAELLDHGATDVEVSAASKRYRRDTQSEIDRQLTNVRREVERWLSCELQ